MPTARPLSTTELGEIRYNQAIASNRWPIQVSIIPPSFDPASTQYTLVIPGLPTAPFLETCHRDIRATLEVPPGPHTYTIYRDDEKLSSHNIQVQRGQVPIGTTKLASKLKEHQPSGVTQISDSVHGTATVRFVYAEETYSVREAYAIGDGLNLKLHRERSGDFVGETKLKLGIKDIRFRIIPREWTRPNVSVFTRLGWDDAAGERGELITWPLQVRVTQFAKDAKEEVEAHKGVDTVTSSTTTTTSYREDLLSDAQAQLNTHQTQLDEHQAGLNESNTQGKDSQAVQNDGRQTGLDQPPAQGDARREQKDDTQTQLNAHQAQLDGRRGGLNESNTQRKDSQSEQNASRQTSLDEPPTQDDARREGKDDIQTQLNKHQAQLDGRQSGLSASNSQGGDSQAVQNDGRQTGLDQPPAQGDAHREQRDECDSGGGLGVVITGVVALLTGLALTVVFGGENECMNEDVIEKPMAGVLVGKDSSSFDVLKHMRSSSV